MLAFGQLFKKGASSSAIGCNNKKALDKFKLSAAFNPLASSEQLFREKQFDKKLLVKYVCKKLF